MHLEELAPHVGRRLWLTFADGFTAAVRLVGAEPSSAGGTLTLDVLQVVRFGTTDPLRFDLNAALVRPAAHVTHVRPIFEKTWGQKRN